MEREREEGKPRSCPPLSSQVKGWFGPHSTLERKGTSLHWPPRLTVLPPWCLATCLWAGGRRSWSFSQQRWWSASGGTAAGGLPETRWWPWKLPSEPWMRSFLPRQQWPTRQDQGVGKMEKKAVFKQQSSNLGRYTQPCRAEKKRF